MWASGRFIRCSQPLPLPLRVAFKAGKKNDTQNSDGTIGRSFRGPVRDWPLRAQGEGCGKGPALPGAACLPPPLSPGPAPDTASKSSEVGHGTRGLNWGGHSIYFSSSSSWDGVPLLALTFDLRCLSSRFVERRNPHAKPPVPRHTQRCGNCHKESLPGPSPP